MVTRMDCHIGRVMQLVEDLGLDDDTVMMSTSDNGPTLNGAADAAFCVRERAAAASGELERTAPEIGRDAHKRRGAGPWRALMLPTVSVSVSSSARSWHSASPGTNSLN